MPQQAIISNQAFHVQTFLSNFARIFSPKAFISASRYLCSGPYGVAGVGDAITDWLIILPIFFFFWKIPCHSFISSNTLQSHEEFGSTIHSLGVNSVEAKHSYTPCIFTTSYRVILLVSPLVVGMLVETVPSFILFFKRWTHIIQSRNSPEQPVQDLLKSLELKGRVKRVPRYDVYLPPQPSHTEKNPINLGLILIPGFLVSHASYAPVAHRISNYGISVIVLSLEPYRIPIPEMGASFDHIKKVIKRASKNILRNYGGVLGNWNLCGHSAGGYAAMQVFGECACATENQLRQHKGVNASDGYSKTDQHFQNLIFWGAGTISELLTDVSSVPFPCQVLVLEASEDPISQFTHDSRKTLRSKFPKLAIHGKRTTVTHKSIKGGNHGGFAHYPDSPFDGKRKISKDTQHKLVSKLTSNFLLK